MERNVTLLVPSLMRSILTFPGVDAQLEPRPLPLIRRVELELGGRSPDALGSPPEPIWAPYDDPQLSATLEQIQREQDRSRASALRRRSRTPASARETVVDDAAPRQVGISQRNMSRFQRSITWFLRHGATTQARPNGYVPIQDVVSAVAPRHSGATVDNVLQTAEADEKGRYSVMEEGGILYIRANQGHSIATIDSELLMTPIENAADVPVCLHGTYEDALKNIVCSGGLNRMQRQSIQMSVGLPNDPNVRSGIRAGVEVVIYIDVDRAMRGGLLFYRSANNVICCEGPIPLDCFARVVRLKDGTLLDVDQQDD
jgi:2'-phosphotransferase